MTRSALPQTTVTGTAAPIAASAGWSVGWEPNSLLRAIVEMCTFDDLIDGVTCGDLFDRMHSLNGVPSDESALGDLLSLLAAAQVTMQTSPPVLTYNEMDRKLYITDRSFVFFVRYGAPHWPWNSA
jgi:hypothetical protein